MADQKNSISENRFSCELDGIPTFKATKITGGDEKHDFVKTFVGNDPYAKMGRGRIEPEDVVITVPSGLYDSALSAFQQWFTRYFDGDDTTPKSGRFITYDDKGKTPVETWELRDCVPVSIKPDDKSADGSNTATVSVTIHPYKVRRI